MKYNDCNLEIASKIEPGFVQDFCQCLFQSNILQNIDTTLHIFNVVTEVFDLEHQEGERTNADSKQDNPQSESQEMIIKPCLKSENIGSKLKFLLQKTEEFQAKRQHYQLSLEREQQQLEKAKQRFQELSQGMHYMVLDSETMKSQISVYLSKIDELNQQIRLKENEQQTLQDNLSSINKDIRRNEEAFLRITSNVAMLDLQAR